jgi:hypothetical protein
MSVHASIYKWIYIYIYIHTNIGEISSLFTFNVVSALWDSFEPMACDIHSASHSQIRDTFMKLVNRPGLDFKSVFNSFADKMLAKKIARLVEKEVCIIFLDILNHALFGTSLC